MKIICDCGAITELLEPEDGSSYTPHEGWYKVDKGDIELYGEHDQVFFHCTACGKEEWIFT
jgi:hypothetical protein